MTHQNQPTEGSLQAPTRHPLNWQSEDFYNQNALNQEMERVFDICHTCRRCVNLCQAFPTLFNLIDTSETLEIDGVEKAAYQQVVDQCYLCDLCYMTKCPYVPPHEWNIDFPHLMLRAKALHFQNNKTTRAHKILSSPQTIGQAVATLRISNLVNWANKRTGFRKFLSKVMDIHPKSLLPEYHPKNPNKRANGQTSERAKHKVAIFATCYGTHHMPSIVTDLIDVLQHNSVEVVLVEKTKCCGMPKLELGDIQTIIAYANRNKKPLLDLINQGYKLIAPVPSCVLMFKNELPMILPDDADIVNIAHAFYDPFEYLQQLADTAQLNTKFSKQKINVLYQVACHQRVQNIGGKTKKILGLIPNLKLTIANRCSGHDGTYGVKNNSYEYAVKIGAPITKQINEETDYIVSDCVMAAKHIAHISPHQKAVKHPISLLKMAYKI